MFILLLSSLLSFITATNCDLVFGVQPKVINVGVTKNLVLNCSVTSNFVSDTSSITQLDLSRLNPITGEFDQILSMIQNSPNGAGLIEHTDNFKWTVKHGETYVSLTIPNPTEVDATEYMCEVHRSSQANPQQAKVEVQLQEPNTDTVEIDLSKNVSVSSNPDENVMLCSQSKGVVRISLDPDELTVGTTKDLHVMCIVSRQDSSDIFNWISIVISHSQRTDNPHFEDLLMIKKFEGQVQKVSFDHFRSDLKIQSDGTVYAKISWRFPELNRVGLYRCELNGIDTWGRPQTLSSTSFLPASRNEVDTIYESIRKFKSMVTQSMSKVRSEINNIKESLYQCEQTKNTTEILSTEISNLKEDLIDNIDFVKQQEDLRVKLERYVNNTNKLISSEVNNLKEITDNLTSELKIKSNIHTQTRCEDNIKNLTTANEEILQKVNDVTNNLTDAVKELKLNQSNEYLNLRNSLQDCKNNVNSASERLRAAVAEIKKEQLDQKSDQRSLRSNLTNLENLYNSLKRNIDTNAQNLSSLRLILDKHKTNYTQGNLEAVEKSLRDKIDFLIKNTSSSLTQFLKGYEKSQNQTVDPILLNKNERNGLFFGSSCRRYWLTKNIYTYFSVADAQSICIRFGGYLAEIDSDIEYGIIKNFVNRHINRGTIIVGGTDSLNEGYWINRFSLTRITSQWENKFDRLKDRDCQCLFFNANLYFALGMKDCSCYFIDHPQGRFLCEIPV